MRLKSNSALYKQERIYGRRAQRDAGRESVRRYGRRAQRDAGRESVRRYEETVGGGEGGWRENRETLLRVGGVGKALVR